MWKRAGLEYIVVPFSWEEWCPVPIDELIFFRRGRLNHQPVVDFFPFRYFPKQRGHTEGFFTVRVKGPRCSIEVFTPSPEKVCGIFPVNFYTKLLL